MLKKAKSLPDGGHIVTKTLKSLTFQVQDIRLRLSLYANGERPTVSLSSRPAVSQCPAERNL